MTTVRRLLALCALTAAVLCAPACMSVRHGIDLRPDGSGRRADTSATTGPLSDQVEVTLSEFAITQPLTVPSGGVLELYSGGATSHQLVIGSGDGAPLVAPELEPGATSLLEVDLPAGQYTLYCAIPGHRWAGMFGTLTVTAPTGPAGERTAADQLRWLTWAAATALVAVLAAVALFAALQRTTRRSAAAATPPAAPAMPAGWYADPYTPGRYRWWDGTAWTGQTR